MATSGLQEWTTRNTFNLSGGWQQNQIKHLANAISRHKKNLRHISHHSKKKKGIGMCLCLCLCDYQVSAMAMELISKLTKAVWNTVQSKPQLQSKMTQQYIVHQHFTAYAHCKAVRLCMTQRLSSTSLLSWRTQQTASQKHAESTGKVATRLCHWPVGINLIVRRNWSGKAELAWNHLDSICNTLHD